MDKKTCVKPKVTLELITSLVQQRYGLQSLTITPLVGFTDLNFKVTVARDQLNDQSDNVEKPCTRYVLKIVGSESLADVDYLEAQCQLIMHLKRSGIPTTGVILNLENHLFSVENLPTEDGLYQKFILRLLEYIPGYTVLDAGNPLHLLPEIGKLTGKVDNSLRNFYHPALGIIYDWQLTSVTSLRSLLTSLSADQQELGRTVIQAYEERVLPILDTLQRGTCHGDINNCNVIVNGGAADDSNQIAGAGNNTDLKIVAVIDFGDSCVGYYVYEIATAVADLMTSCKGQYDPLEVTRLVIHGYLSEFKLHEQELRILKLVICVRLLQTYVLSTDMMTRDPDNKYITLELEDAMETLKFLWNLPDETFQRSVFVQCDDPHVRFQSKNSNSKKAENPNQVKKKRLDFLDILLTARDENGNGMTDEEIRQEWTPSYLQAKYVYSHETTRSAIYWGIYALGKYPVAQEKVYEEIEPIIGEKTTLDWFRIKVDPTHEVESLPEITMKAKTGIRVFLEERTKQS